MHGADLLWIVIGVVVTAVIGLAVKGTRRRKSPVDLGSVSERWVAECRASSSMGSSGSRR